MQLKWLTLPATLNRGTTKMPFKSKAQQRFLEAHPEKLKGKIKEWESATNFSTLPEKAKKVKKRGSTKQQKSGL